LAEFVGSPQNFAIVSQGALAVMQKTDPNIVQKLDCMFVILNSPRGPTPSSKTSKYTPPPRRTPFHRTSVTVRWHSTGDVSNTLLALFLSVVQHHVGYSSSHAAACVTSKHIVPL
jgi:hypothetical protein